MNIGNSIRELRESRGLSQVDLAARLQITSSMLCQIERGTKTPSLVLGVDIAKALGCTLEDITGDIG